VKSASTILQFDRFSDVLVRVTRRAFLRTHQCRASRISCLRVENASRGAREQSLIMRFIRAGDSCEVEGWEPEGGSCSRMTSDREDRRVRRGHAWAREAQDFAPRHAQASLPPRPSLSSLSLSHSLFLPLLSSLKRGRGPSHPSALLARSRHVILRDWLVSCPRAALPVCRMMYRVKWRMERRTVVALCIYFAFLPPLLPRSLGLGSAHDL